MSRAATHSNGIVSSDQPIKTEFAPGERPLYFKNEGLFSDPFLTHHLPSLENLNKKDASLKYLDEYWNEASYEGYGALSHAYAQIIYIWDQYNEFLPDYNEAQLEERWIKPIFKLLGWTYEVQDSKTKRAKRNVPDYSLFQSGESYIKAKKTKTDEAYFKHVSSVADAKAWKIALDGIGRSNNNPSYQIVRYMEHSEQEWAILTNGRFWRLYSTRSNSKHTTYYEIDLVSLITKRDDERFKYFYNMFRKDAFIKENGKQCFLDVVFEEGVYYAKEVEDNLKYRVFEVVEGIAKGFVRNRVSLTEDQLKEIYDHSLYYLFRLMFILNCESKNLLSVDQTSDYYEYSLRRQITRLKEQFDGSQNWSAQSRTYDLINSLFDMLANGDERIGVHGFGSEVFSSGKPEFYNLNSIPDFNLNEALVQLACDYDDSSNSDELQFIDYKRLSENHLGSLFEGLLEYKLDYADEKLAVSKSGKIKKCSDLTEKQKKSLKNSVINKDELFLSSESGERKATGSYYTPQMIVDCIIKRTLGPICSNKSPANILKVRVCDPAMGSGHFLLGVVKYLEELIQDYIYKDEKNNDIDLDKLRWEILDKCIFGVDINPLAVELSKFSLWMYTARKGFRLERLSDQLMCGDSLVDSMPNYKHNFDWNMSIWKKKNIAKFDAIVGNPPYVFTRGQHFDSDQKSYFEKFKTGKGKLNTFALFFERSMDLVKKGAPVGFICPSNLLRTTTYEPLRKFLLNETNIYEIADPDFHVFKGVTAETVLVFSLNEKSNGPLSIVKISEDGSSEHLRKANQSKYSKNVSSVFTINMTKEQLDVFENIVSRSTPLEEFTDYIIEGIVTPKGKGKYICTGKPKTKKYKPFLEGKDIGAFRTFYKKKFIMYDRNILHRARPEEVFLADEKILIQRISGGKRPVVAAYDNEQYYSFASINNVILKNEWKGWYKYLTGILNSQLLNSYYGLNFTNFSNLTVNIAGTFLEKLPIIFDKNRKGELDKLVSDLLKSKSGSSKEASVVDKIDQCVYKIYDLNSNEKRIVDEVYESIEVDEVEAA